MERHDHLSALEWHFSADVVPYIYFYRVELFSVQRNVLDVLIDPAYDKTFSAVNVYSAQQRHFEIAHDRWLNDVAIDEQRIESSLQVADAFGSVRRFSGQQFHQAVSVFREFSCLLFDVGLAQVVDAFVIFYRTQLRSVFFGALPIEIQQLTEILRHLYGDDLISVFEISEYPFGYRVVRKANRFDIVRRSARVILWMILPGSDANDFFVVGESSGEVVFRSEQSIVDLFHQLIGSFVMTWRRRYVDEFGNVRVQQQQKHVRFAIGHVVPRNRELNFRKTDFPFARQIERMRQFRNVVGESVVRIIVHRAVARQSHVERTHFCGAMSSETATNNRDNHSATRSTDSNPRDSTTD